MVFSLLSGCSSRPCIHAVIGQTRDFSCAGMRLLRGDQRVSAGVLDIAIRLPNGERIMRRFAATQQVLDVLNYARRKCPAVGRDSKVAAQMPRKLLPLHESLRSAGVTNRETLTVEQKD